VLISTLEDEAAGLLREIINDSAEGRPESLSTDAMTGAWKMLPQSKFSSVDTFLELSRTAIHEFWQPGWSDERWRKIVQESWRRLLIRLFVAGRVIAHQRGSARADSAAEAMMADMRHVVTMATHSAAVARLMLEARFGDDLTSPYQPSGGRRREGRA
jgi:hypothetical protein